MWPFFVHRQLPSRYLPTNLACPTTYSSCIISIASCKKPQQSHTKAVQPCPPAPPPQHFQNGSDFSQDLIAARLARSITSHTTDDVPRYSKAYTAGEGHLVDRVERPPQQFVCVGLFSVRSQVMCRFEPEPWLENGAFSGGDFGALQYLDTCRHSLRVCERETEGGRDGEFENKKLM